tara:strand:+ start:132 stop:410 length:279 start_codon:yes stop_codon:yes gene_type:complete
LSRQKLTQQLKDKHPVFNSKEIENIINIFTNNIIDILKKKNNLEIRGFGRWYFKTLKENFNSRNPKSGELIYTPERMKIRFRPSKKLKELVI